MLSKYPAVRFALFFSAGILLNDLITLNYLYLLFPSALLILTIITGFFNIRLNSALFTFFIYGNILMTGFLCSEVNRDYKNFVPQEIIKEEGFIVYGKIETVDLIRENEVSYTIQADSFSFSSFSYTGNVGIIGRFKSDNKRQLDSIYSIIYPGNTIKQTGTFMRGRGVRNPGEFSYNAYLKTKGISGILTSSYADQLEILNYEKSFLKSMIFDVRKALDQTIKHYHTPATASLLRGLLLADRSGINYETKEDFIDTGVMHILAVSGLHTGYIALIFLLLFGRFGIITRSMLTISGLIIFLVITGVPVSVFRAVVMAVVLAVTVITNRSTNIYNTLSAAAIIILFFSPSEIYNPGFQLSFSAVFSIAFIYPIIKELLLNKFIIQNNFIRSFVLFTAVTFAAQLGTLPLTIYYFGKLSIISIAVNIFVIPAVGLIICTAAAMLCFSFLIPQAADLYSSANELFTRFLFTVVESSADLDFAFLRINQFSIMDVLICYTAIGLLLFMLPRLQLKGFLIFLTLLLLNISLLTSIDNKVLMAEDKLSIMMIDVGQGDSFLLKFPCGTTFLIDAGEANINFDNGERIIIPLLDYLDIDRVDYAYITHLDLDHYGGIISLVANNRIKHLLKAPPDLSNEDKRLEEFLKKRGQSFSYYTNEIMNFENLKVYSLSGAKEIPNESLRSNDQSGVLKIVYGNTSILFSGDLEKAGERIYSAEYQDFLKADVLKVSHHGSKSASSEEFINFVDQKFALISAGYKNRFNHPSNEVLERLNNNGSRIMRTDLQGAVLLESDGYKIKIVEWNN